MHYLKKQSLYELSSKEGSTIRSLVLITFTILSSATTIAHASTHDRRITIKDTEAMVTTAKHDHQFPTTVNEEILAQLNRYIGTPDGREFIRRSMERKKKYDKVLNAAIVKHNMPPELLALPIVESGYRNITQGKSLLHGAGIWMFIQSTARNFELRVNNDVDERLNVAKETDAAMRYLASLNLRFKDWGLALLAYNAGEGFIQRAINETDSRDAWHLVRNRYENDPGYLAKVMAAALIMKNPVLLK